MAAWRTRQAEAEAHLEKVRASYPIKVVASTKRPPDEPLVTAAQSQELEEWYAHSVCADEPSN